MYKRDFNIRLNLLGRTQKVNFVNESGMYALIFGSTKDEAKRFKRWVTSEVLPTLRKTGSYSLPTPQTLSTVKDRNGLVKTCEWFVRVASHLGYDEVWNLVHHRFNINRACELTTEQVGQATEYLQGLLLGVIAQRRGFNPQTPLPLPPMHRTDVGKYDNDGVLWTRVLEPDEQIVRTKDIAQLIINEPYIDGETLTAINYASSARLASMLKNPPFLTTLDNAKEM
ncbi:BRO-N domain-containing protein [Moraxella lacunata]|nr:BRO family protein [Moraxella lacunata]